MHLLHVQGFFLVQTAGDDAWEGDDEAHHDDLNHHKGHSTPVDLTGGDRLNGFLRGLIKIGLQGGNAAQVEQGKTKWRMHERCLHIHSKQHTKPNQVDAQLVCDGAQQGHHNESQFEKVEKEGQYKDQNIDNDQEAELTARQVAQQVLHPYVSIHPLEHQAKAGRANQNEHHKAGQFGGGGHGLAQQQPAEAAARHRHDDGTQGTHGAAFGGRGNAQEDRAQHQKDQQQRWNQHESDTLSHA